MFKMPLFDMNTRPETFVSLIHCIIDDTLSQAMPDLRQTLLQFIDVMNLVLQIFPYMHLCKRRTSFNVIQEYANN